MFIKDPQNYNLVFFANYVEITVKFYIEVPVSFGYNYIMFKKK